MRLIFVPALIIVAAPTDVQVAVLSNASFVAGFVVHAPLAELWSRATRRRNVSGAGVEVKAA